VINLHYCDNWDVKQHIQNISSELTIMPPKTRNDAAEPTDADSKLNTILAKLSSMSNNMAAMNQRLDKVDLLGEQLNNIEESMRNISTEHAAFKTTLANTQTTITNIQANQVTMDQYNRSWSMRIMNLQLSTEDEANPFRIAETIYTKVFLPILTGAYSEDLIPRIPTCEQLLEMAPCPSRCQGRRNETNHLQISQPRLQGSVLPPQEEVRHQDGRAGTRRQSSLRLPLL